MVSVRANFQEMWRWADFTDEQGNPGLIVVTLRYDDRCGNGHNDFGVTAEIYGPERRPNEPTIRRNGRTLWQHSCGCNHEAVVKHFPELAEYLKWHLCGATGPLHYIENALYWAGHSGWCDGKPNSPPNRENLEATIVYGALPSDHNYDPMSMSADELRAWLERRLPLLLGAFQLDMLRLGFTY